jgi:hypothetical protein
MLRKQKRLRYLIPAQSCYMPRTGPLMYNLYTEWAGKRALTHIKVSSDEWTSMASLSSFDGLGRYPWDSTRHVEAIKVLRMIVHKSWWRRGRGLEQISPNSVLSFSLGTLLVASPLETRHYGAVKSEESITTDLGSHLVYSSVALYSWIHEQKQCNTGAKSDLCSKSGRRSRERDLWTFNQSHIDTERRLLLQC